MDSVDLAATCSLLDGCQLLMFTDNTTAERVKSLTSQYGPSSSKTGNVAWCQTHVGACLGQANGISQEEMHAGMIAGQSIFSFIPIHLSAKERSSGLIKWIQS